MENEADLCYNYPLYLGVRLSIDSGDKTVENLVDPEVGGEHHFDN